MEQHTCEHTFKAQYCWSSLQKKSDKLQISLGEAKFDKMIFKSFINKSEPAMLSPYTACTMSM